MLRELNNAPQRRASDVGGGLVGFVLEARQLIDATLQDPGVSPELAAAMAALRSAVDLLDEVTRPDENPFDLCAYIFESPDTEMTGEGDATVRKGQAGDGVAMEFVPLPPSRPSDRANGSALYTERQLLEHRQAFGQAAVRYVVRTLNAKTARRQEPFVERRASRL